MIIAPPAFPTFQIKGPMRREESGCRFPTTHLPPPSPAGTALAQTPQINKSTEGPDRGFDCSHKRFEVRNEKGGTKLAVTGRLKLASGKQISKTFALPRDSIDMEHDQFTALVNDIFVTAVTWCREAAAASQ